MKVMLMIYGLPPKTKYQDVKLLLRNKCNVADSILWNLSFDGPEKHIRVEAADEEKANRIEKCLHGLNIGTSILKVAPCKPTGNYSNISQLNQRSQNKTLIHVSGPKGNFSHEQVTKGHGNQYQGPQVVRTQNHGPQGDRSQNHGSQSFRPQNRGPQNDIPQDHAPQDERCQAHGPQGSRSQEHGLLGARPLGDRSRERGVPHGSHGSSSQGSRPEGSGSQDYGVQGHKPQGFDPQSQTLQGVVSQTVGAQGILQVGGQQGLLQQVPGLQGFVQGYGSHDYPLQGYGQQVSQSFGTQGQVHQSFGIPDFGVQGQFSAGLVPNETVLGTEMNRPMWANDNTNQWSSNQQVINQNNYGFQPQGQLNVTQSFPQQMAQVVMPQDMRSMPLASGPPTQEFGFRQHPDKSEFNITIMKDNFQGPGQYSGMVSGHTMLGQPPQGHFSQSWNQTVQHNQFISQNKIQDGKSYGDRKHSYDHRGNLIAQNDYKDGNQIYSPQLRSPTKTKPTEPSRPHFTSMRSDSPSMKSFKDVRPGSPTRKTFPNERLGSPPRKSFSNDRLGSPSKKSFINERSGSPSNISFRDVEQGIPSGREKPYSGRPNLLTFGSEPAGSEMRHYYHGRNASPPSHLGTLTGKLVQTAKETEIPFCSPVSQSDRSLSLEMETLPRAPDTLPGKYDLKSGHRERSNSTSRRDRKSYSPKNRRSSPRRFSSNERRMSRRDSPGRFPPHKRSSPSRYLVSPPRSNMRYSPPRHADQPINKYMDSGTTQQPKIIRPAYEPKEAQKQTKYSGYRPNVQNIQNEENERISPWRIKDRNKDGLETPSLAGREKAAEPKRKHSLERNPMKHWDMSPSSSFDHRSPTPRSPRRSWFNEKQRSPEIGEAPPPPTWPGQSITEEVLSPRHRKFVEKEAYKSKWDTPPREETRPYKETQVHNLTEAERSVRFSPRRGSVRGRSAYKPRSEMREDYRKSADGEGRGRRDLAHPYRRHNSPQRVDQRKMGNNEEIHDDYYRPVESRKNTTESRPSRDRRIDTFAAGGKKYIEQSSEPKQINSVRNNTHEKEEWWKIGNISHMDAAVKSKIYMAEAHITDEIMERHAHLNLQGHYRIRVMQELKLMLGKIFLEMFDVSKVPYIEIIVKYHARFNAKDEEEMLNDIMAKFPNPIKYKKRKGEDKSKEVPPKTSRSNVTNKSEEPAREYSGNSSKPAREYSGNCSQPAREYSGNSSQTARERSGNSSIAVEPEEAKSKPDLPRLHNYFKLSPLMSKVVESELEDLMIQVWQALPNSTKDDNEKAVVKALRNNASDLLTNALGLNITKRLLNVYNPLKVKLLFDDPPDLVELREFVKKHNFSVFKKAETYNLYLAEMRTIQDFDAICSMKNIKCGSTSLSIKSKYDFLKCPNNISTCYKTDNSTSATDKDLSEDIKSKQTVVEKSRNTSETKANIKPIIANKEIKITQENESSVKNSPIDPDKGNVKSPTKANPSKTDAINNEDSANSKVQNTQPDIPDATLESNATTSKTASDNANNATSNNSNASKTIHLPNTTKGQAVSKPINVSKTPTKSNASQQLKTNKSVSKPTNTSKVIKKTTMYAQKKIRPAVYDDDDSEELSDHDILALMSEGIILDQCSGSDIE